jgi:hypothetical protein
VKAEDQTLKGRVKGFHRRRSYGGQVASRGEKHPIPMNSVSASTRQGRCREQASNIQCGQAGAADTETDFKGFEPLIFTSQR